MPTSTPAGFLLDLDGTLYTGDAAIPGAADALSGLRTRAVPFRLVTNTTSRSRRMLVDRLAGYGLAVAPEEIVTATLAGVELIRAAGYGRVAPFVPAGALEDMQALTLAGGTSGRPRAAADVVVLGDLGERWTFALLQEAFEQLMAGAELVALSRDRYFRQGDRLKRTMDSVLAAAVDRLACQPGSPARRSSRPRSGVSGCPRTGRSRWWGTISGATSRAPSAPACRAGWSEPASFARTSSRAAGSRPTASSPA